MGWDGRFERGELLGSGGLGNVYHARDRETGAQVALKVIRLDGERGPSLTEGSLEGERFMREARLLEQLDHPAIVRYVAHGRTLRGEPYLVMERLSGRTLADRLTDGPLELGDCLRLGLRLAEGLGAAHGLGILHRDVKPDNIVLCGGAVERATLIDFGIARMETQASEVTLRGTRIGTLRYMSPEQVQGEVNLTPAVDVFALGCVMYECLTGRCPFDGPTPAVVAGQILCAEPEPAGRYVPLSPGVDQLLSRMMSKGPMARPSDGVALAEALRAVLADSTGGESASPFLLDERRVVCAIAVSRSECSDEVQRTLSHLSRDAGARDSTEGGATLVYVLAAHQSATDLAARGARLALRFRAAGASRVAAAMGRGEISGSVYRGEATAEATAVLRSPAARGASCGVFVNDTLQNLLGERFTVGPAGLVHASPAEIAAQPSGREAVQFVGRELEKASLTGAIRGTLSGAGASGVLVLGEAGIGKSRLLREALAELPDREAQTWFARGDVMETAAPFSLLRRALENAAGVLDTDGVEQRGTKIRLLVEQHVAPRDLDRTVLFIGELLGLPAPRPLPRVLATARRHPQVMGDEMQNALWDVVGGIARQRGLLLILEDAHWGDFSSIRLVRASFANAAKERIRLCVIALSRPNARERIPELLDIDDWSTLELAPLPTQVAVEMARVVLAPDTDPAAVDRLAERSSGNPFFLQELARAQAGSKHAEAPETVLAVVGSRLSSMEPEIREVLREASLFGRAFSTAGVASVAGRSPDAVGELLEELRVRDLLELAAQPEAGGTTYVFSHDLIHQAAYAMLTDRDKTRGHFAVGEWLEGRAFPSPRVLAEHFDRGDAPERAAPWFAQAAELSLAANDLTEAIEAASRGLACRPGHLIRGRLERTSAEAWRWRGEFSKCTELATQAAGHLDPRAPEWFEAAGLVIEGAAFSGDYALAEDWTRRATGAEASGEAQEARLICAAQGIAQLFLGGRVGAANELSLAMDGAGTDVRASSPAVDAAVERALAWRDYFADDLAGALVHTKTCAAAHQRAGNERRACQEWTNAGHLLLELGRFQEANQLFSQWMPLAERLDLKAMVANTLQGIGWVHAIQGEVDEARRSILDSLDIARRIGHVRIESVGHRYLARIALLNGDYSTAETQASLAEARLTESQGLLPVAIAARALAVLGLGRHEEALAISDRGLQVLATLGAAAEEGDGLLRLAVIQSLAACGRLDDARVAAREACARLHERASRLGEYGESFLLEIPEHAETIRWGQLGAK